MAVHLNIIPITKQFTLKKLIDMMAKRELKELSKEFKAIGLNSKEFIKAMQKHINYNPKDELDLIYCLSKLFTEIDIDGKGRIHWREFTQYFIDVVIRNKEIRNANGQPLNQKNLVEQAHFLHLKFPRFIESVGLDSLLHEGIIQSVQYYPSLNQILLIEHRSQTLKFLSLDLKRRNFVNLYGKNVDLYNNEDYLIKLRDKNTFVIAAAYNEGSKFLICTCSNKTLQVFGLHGDEFKRQQIISTKGTQYSIWYFKDCGRWVTRSRVAEKEQDNKKEYSYNDKDNIQFSYNYINIWRFDEIGLQMRIIHSMHAHNGDITDCIEINNPPVIVTCSIDHKIKLWDIINGCKIGSLKPKDTAGVRHIDYTDCFGNLIISTTYETFIKVWSPCIPPQQAYVGSLRGHDYTVVQAKFFKDTPYVVSIDEKLNIRIWDIRTFTCIQTVQQNRKDFDCNGICLIASHFKFFAFGSRLLYFSVCSDNDLYKAVSASEAVYPIQVIFNKYYKSFYVLTK